MGDIAFTDSIVAHCKEAVCAVREGQDAQFMGCPLRTYRELTCQTPVCNAQFIRYGRRLMNYEWRSHLLHHHADELRMLQYLVHDLEQLCLEPAGTTLVTPRSASNQTSDKRAACSALVCVFGCLSVHGDSFCRHAVLAHTPELSLLAAALDLLVAKAHAENCCPYAATCIGCGSPVARAGDHSRRSDDTHLAGHDNGSGVDWWAHVRKKHLADAVRTVRGVLEHAAHAFNQGQVTQISLRRSSRPDPNPLFLARCPLSHCSAPATTVAKLAMHMLGHLRTLSPTSTDDGAAMLTLAAGGQAMPGNGHAAAAAGLSCPMPSCCNITMGLQSVRDLAGHLHRQHSRELRSVAAALAQHARLHNSSYTVVCPLHCHKSSVAGSSDSAGGGGCDTAQSRCNSTFGSGNMRDTTHSRDKLNTAFETSHDQHATMHASRAALQQHLLSQHSDAAAVLLAFAEGAARMCPDGRCIICGDEARGTLGSTKHLLHHLLEQHTQQLVKVYHCTQLLASSGRGSKSPAAQCPLSCPQQLGSNCTREGSRLAVMMHLAVAHTEQLLGLSCSASGPATAPATAPASLRAAAVTTSRLQQEHVRDAGVQANVITVEWITREVIRQAYRKPKGNRPKAAAAPPPEPSAPATLPSPPRRMPPPDSQPPHIASTSPLQRDSCSGGAISTDRHYSKVQNDGAMHPLGMSDQEPSRRGSSPALPQDLDVEHGAEAAQHALQHEHGDTTNQRHYPAAYLLPPHPLPPGSVLPGSGRTQCDEDPVKSRQQQQLPSPPPPWRHQPKQVQDLDDVDRQQQQQQQHSHRMDHQHLDLTRQLSKHVLEQPTDASAQVGSGSFPDLGAESSQLAGQPQHPEQRSTGHRSAGRPAGSPALPPASDMHTSSLQLPTSNPMQKLMAAAAARAGPSVPKAATPPPWQVDAPEPSAQGVAPEHGNYSDPTLGPVPCSTSPSSPVMDRPSRRMPAMSASPAPRGAAAPRMQMAPMQGLEEQEDEGLENETSVDETGMDFEEDEGDIDMGPQHTHAGAGGMDLGADDSPLLGTVPQDAAAQFAALDLDSAPEAAAGHRGEGAHGGGGSRKLAAPTFMNLAIAEQEVEEDEDNSDDLAPSESEEAEEVVSATKQSNDRVMKASSSAAESSQPEAHAAVNKIDKDAESEISADSFLDGDF